ncbi:MAG: M56 family metallopeptidase [Micromonosporaceae bacterium]|jgi:Zn-dependent protease with chaperone function|nr:M56 family metallopeptidase [Micromonosporaceae bacterium]
MLSAAPLAGVLVACWPVALLLTRARWTWRSPRVAILCWQAVGLTLGLSAIGLPLAYGLAPYHLGTVPAVARLTTDLARGQLPAQIGPARLAGIGAGLVVGGWLIGTTVACLVRTVRLRRRHRQLLVLVARDDPAAPGALVLDHPGAAAYCLPGVLRSRVVVSAGTLSLLGRAELAAVLSHERAHADERHDLVLLPFTALARALPQAGWLRRARRALAAIHEAVALLVEMRADDRARQRHTEGPLAAALVRFATAPSVTPPGALGLADEQHLQARLERLLQAGQDGSRLLPAVALAAAVMLVSVPLSQFVVPL